MLGAASGGSLLGGGDFARAVYRSPQANWINTGWGSLIRVAVSEGSLLGGAVSALGVFRRPQGLT